MHWPRPLSVEVPPACPAVRLVRPAGPLPLAYPLCLYKSALSAFPGPLQARFPCLPKTVVTGRAACAFSLGLGVRWGARRPILGAVDLFQWAGFGGRHTPQAGGGPLGLSIYNKSPAIYNKSSAPPSRLPPKGQTAPRGRQPPGDKLRSFRACLPTGPAQLAPREPPTGAMLECHHPFAGVVRGRGRAKRTLSRSLASWVLCLLDLPGRSRGVVGQPGQITLCRVLPVHRGYRLRGVWLSLSLPLCASSVGAIR